MDICSRKVVHWEIWPSETGILAGEFIAIESNGGIMPKAVYADRGTSMTNNIVSGLYAKLNIVQSHSRPHVSNDNPFSESAFKTLKYCLTDSASAGRRSGAAPGQPTTAAPAAQAKRASQRSDRVFGRHRFALTVYRASEVTTALARSRASRRCTRVPSLRRWHQLSTASGGGLLTRG
jgi:transposase InsO family protein